MILTRVLGREGTDAVAAAGREVEHGALKFVADVEGRLDASLEVNVTLGVDPD